ncbi:hypothetical protein Q5752_006327 [Cryptotrichosporon argae]
MAVPHTLPHTFALAPLRAHFAKTPNPPGANRLIDMPGDVFVDTEDDMHLIAAALWVLAVQWDKMAEDDRPKDKEHMRHWIVMHREVVLKSLSRHVEPPFHFATMHHVERDVSTLLHELLEQTLPPVDKTVRAPDGKDSKSHGHGAVKNEGVEQDGAQAK